MPYRKNPNPKEQQSVKATFFYQNKNKKRTFTDAGVLSIDPQRSP